MKYACYFLFLAITPIAFGQEIMPLSHSKGDRVYFDFAGSNMYSEGHLHKINASFTTSPKGGVRRIKFVTVELSHMGAG